MELNWTWATLAAGVMLAVMAHFKHDADARGWMAWSITLQGARQALATWLRTQTRAQMALLGPTLDVAHERHAAQRDADALHAIAQADALTGRQVAWMQRCLTRWNDVARTQAIPWRLPPPSCDPSKLAALRALARLERLAGAVLPWGTWRLHLRRVALLIVGVTCAYVARRARHAETIEAALHSLRLVEADLHTLDRQINESFEHLLRLLPEPPSPNPHA